MALSSKTLRVENFEKEVSESMLFEAFSNCGDVESLVIDPAGSSAFVHFKLAEHASAAMKLFEKTPLAVNARLRIEFVCLGKLKSILKCGICSKHQCIDLCLQPSHTLKGIFHAYQNGGLSASEAFEALNHLNIQWAATLKNQDHEWTPFVCERLLSTNANERALADSCLKLLMSKLQPPTPLFAQTVEQSIKNILLNRMEELIDVEAYKVPVVRGWSWLMSLLGNHILENRDLVNRMLKILEKSFIDKDVEVRIASQGAWKAMVDILLPTAVESDNNMALASPKPKVVLTSKRLKLLMTPLVGTMTVEKLDRSRNSCWKQCIYILQKLGSLLCKASVMQFVLVPMFESAFKSGRNSWNTSVWDSSACLFEEFLSLKLNSNKNCSVMVKEGTLIRWPVWNSCHIEHLLKIFGSLWNSYLENFKGSESSDNRKLLLKYVLRIWHLILKGLATERIDMEQVSDKHQSAIHLALKFVSVVCSDVTSLCGKGCDRSLILSVWPFLEYIVLEFGSEILVSSLYELPINHQDNGSLVTFMSCTAAKCNGELQSTSGQISKTANPIFYISKVWMTFLADLGFHELDTDKILQRMGDRLLLSLWLGFIEQHLGTQSENASDFLCYSQYEAADQFPLSLLLFPLLLSSISKSLEISDAIPLTLHSEGFCELSDNTWSLETDIINISSIKYSFECLKSVISSIEGHHLDIDLECLSNLSTNSSFITSLWHKYTQVCGRFVCYDVREINESFKKNAFREYEPQECNNEILTRENLRELVRTISLAAGFLMLLSETATPAETSECSARVFEALDELSHSISSRNGKYVFVKILSWPLANKLCSCLDHKLTFHEKNSYEEEDQASILKHIGKFLGTFRNFIYPMDTTGSNEDTNLSNQRNINVLVIVSRLLTITWELLSYYKEMDMDPISRVCEGLICFSSHLKTQEDALAYMQTLSNTLIQWFDGSGLALTPTVSGHCMPLLERIWCQMLVSLQNCQPPISFGSEILEKQAPLLASAFQCSYKPIAEETLLFWENTYGSRGSNLSYPSCLIPILQDLQCKVDITLPSFVHTYVSRRGLRQQGKLSTQESRICESAVKKQKGIDKTMIEHSDNHKSIIFPEPYESHKEIDVWGHGRLKKHKIYATEMKNQESLSLVPDKTLSEYKIKEGKTDELENKETTGKISIAKEIRRDKKRSNLRHGNSRPFGNRNIYSTKKDRIVTMCSKIEDSKMGIEAGYNVNSEKEGPEDSEVKREVKKKGRTRSSILLRLLNSDLKTLGIRHLRTLRSVGGLRGGKNWRASVVTKNGPRKTPTRQRHQVDIRDKDNFKSLQALEEDGRRADNEAVTNDYSIQQTEVENSQNAHGNISNKSVSESQFKVRDLGDGAWSNGGNLQKSFQDSEAVVSCPLSKDVRFLSGNKPQLSYRNNRRKSQAPRRIPSVLIGYARPETGHLDLDNDVLSDDCVTAEKPEMLNESGRDDAGFTRPAKRLKTEHGYDVDCHSFQSQMRTNLEEMHCLLKRTAAHRTGTSTQKEGREILGSSNEENIVNDVNEFQPCKQDASKSNTQNGGLACECAHPHTENLECLKCGLPLAKEISRHWSVYDVLHEVSSKIECLRKEDLLKVEKVVNELSNKIAKRKKLLSKRKASL